MKSMIHTRAEAQSDELASPVLLCDSFIAKQIFSTVRQALRLNNLIRLYCAKGPHNGVAWARHNAGIWINVSCAITKLAHKTIPEAFKVLSFGFFETEVVA